MSGLERIAAAFHCARAEQRAALMPYYTLGYPDPGTCIEIIHALARGGADLIELGIPFSDPLADGPTIQRSTQVALAQGMTVPRCLDLVARLRAEGLAQPLLLMGYVNPVLSYGIDRFVADATAAGADGFILPDLPPEEAERMEAACRDHGCALVYLLAPTASPERMRLVVRRTSGFLYLVSLTGVTGARDSLQEQVLDVIGRVRLITQVPLAVGFGISTPGQAAAIGREADGVIVGSALIDTIDRADDPAPAAAAFTAALRRGLENRHL